MLTRVHVQLLMEQSINFSYQKSNIAPLPTPSPFLKQSQLKKINIEMKPILGCVQQFNKSVNVDY